MKYVLIAFAAFSLLGCKDIYSIGKAVPETGRFQIYDTDGSIVLLDTSNGRSWRLVRIMTDKGELYSTEWQSMNKIYTDQ